MTKENLDKTIPVQNNIGIDPNNLNNLIKNANDLQEVLRPHIVWDNKIGIWLNIAMRVITMKQVSMKQLRKLNQFKSAM